MAQAVVGECMWCQKRVAQAQQHIMGDIPHEYLQACAPFSNTALDIFGPLKVQEVSNHRRSFKTWVLLYSCLSSKAISMWVMTGYDAKSCLDAHAKHVSVYGHPDLVISDHGTQIVNGAKQIAQWENATPATARDGTSWRFTEVGSHWHNGLAERAIKMVKESLEHLAPNITSLDVNQLHQCF